MKVYTTWGVQNPAFGDVQASTQRFGWMEFRRVHGSFWNLETAHFGTWLILEPRRKENSPGLQRETNFAAHFGTRIIR